MVYKLRNRRRTRKEENQLNKDKLDDFWTQISLWIWVDFSAIHFHMCRFAFSEQGNILANKKIVFDYLDSGWKNEEDLTNFILSFSVAADPKKINK